MCAETRPSRTRCDPSGTLRRNLDELIARGQCLSASVPIIAGTTELSVFMREHREWVLGALPVLAAGFEPETVTEFVYASSRVEAHSCPATGHITALETTRDAIELLCGLRATLAKSPTG